MIDHDLALHTVFRHSSDQDCVEWVPVEKEGWVVKYNLIPVKKNIQGPASQLDVVLCTPASMAGVWFTVAALSVCTRESIAGTSVI